VGIDKGGRRMIKQLIGWLAPTPNYMYFAKYSHKFYGLCGCELTLRKVNVAQSNYYFVDNYFDNMTIITAEEYDKLKLSPNASTMEFL
jgi:hypothetical protein